MRLQVVISNTAAKTTEKYKQHPQKSYQQYTVQWNLLIPSPHLKVLTTL